MAKPIIDQNGNELITQEDIHNYYVNQLPEVSQADGTTKNVDILGTSGAGTAITEEEILALSNMKDLSKNEELVMKGAQYFDEILSQIPGINEYPYMTDAVHACNIRSPFDMVYVNGTQAMSAPNLLLNLKANENISGFQHEPRSTQFKKAVLAGALVSGKAEVDILYPVKGPDGTIRTEHIKLRPDFSKCKTQEGQSRQELKPDKSKTETTIRGINGVETYFRSQMATLSSDAFRETSVFQAAEEAYNNSLKEEAGQKKSEDMLHGLDGVDEKENTLSFGLTGENDLPAGVTAEELYGLADREGVFAAIENDAALQTGVKAFDAKVLPLLNDHQEGKQPYYDLVGIGKPMDRLMIDGKPVKEHLEKLGYKEENITEDIMKAEVMAALTSGKHHVDIVSVKKAISTATGKELFRGVSAELKPDLSGFDKFAKPGELTRTQQLQAMEMQEAGVKKDEINAKIRDINKQNASKTQVVLESGMQATVMGEGKHAAYGNAANEKEVDINYVIRNNRAERSAPYTNFFKTGGPNNIMAGNMPINDLVKKGGYTGLTGQTPTPADRNYQKDFKKNAPRTWNTSMSALYNKLSVKKIWWRDGKKYGRLMESSAALMESMKKLTDDKGPKGKERDELLAKIAKQADTVELDAQTYHLHATKDGTKTSFGQTAGEQRNEASVELMAFAKMVKEQAEKMLDTPQKAPEPVKAQPQQTQNVPMQGGKVNEAANVKAQEQLKTGNVQTKETGKAPQVKETTLKKGVKKAGGLEGLKSSLNQKNGKQMNHKDLNAQMMKSVVKRPVKLKGITANNSGPEIGRNGK